MADKSNRAAIKLQVRDKIAAISNIGNIFLEDPFVKSDCDLIERYLNSSLGVMLGGWVSIPVGDITNTPATIGQGGYDFNDLPVEVHYVYGVDSGTKSTTGTASNDAFEGKMEDIAQVLRQRAQTIFSAWVEPEPRPQKADAQSMRVTKETPFLYNDVWFVHKGKVSITVREFLQR